MSLRLYSVGLNPVYFEGVKVNVIEPYAVLTTNLDHKVPQSYRIMRLESHSNKSDTYFIKVSNRLVIFKVCHSRGIHNALLSIVKDNSPHIAEDFRGVCQGLADSLLNPHEIVIKTEDK